MKSSHNKLFLTRSIKSLLLIIVASVLVFGLGANNVLADNALNSIIGETPFYDPDETSGTGTCSGSTTGSAGSSTLASGSDVYILGDSITVGAENTYITDFKQIGITTVVDASSSRSLIGKGTDGNKLSGLQAIAADQADIKKAQAVVIALGTNDYDTPANIDSAISALNTSVPVYWVDTIAVDRTYSPEATWDQTVVGPNNQAIYGQAAAEKYTVISWYKTVDPNGDPQNPNGDETDANGYIDTGPGSDGYGVHPTAAGINALVSLVMGTVTGSTSSTQSNPCCSTSSTPTTTSASNLDYAGRPILNSTELQAIAQNMSVYQQAAQAVNIPWEVLAAIHYDERGLELNNPVNGYDANGKPFSNGVYQIITEKYTPGPITNAEFIAETNTAAQFVLSKMPTLTTSSDSDVIKQTFFNYNGAAHVYVTQALSLGFSQAQANIGEGSPYVMNKADAKRDASALPAGEKSWGQIGTDGATITYPAGDEYGAFIVYADLAGISLTGGSENCVSPTINCNSNGPALQGVDATRQSVVCIAEQQLAQWSAPGFDINSGLYEYTGGTYENGTYVGGRNEQWCADFATWVYNQADYPFTPADLLTVQAIGLTGVAGGKFVYHPASSGYVPVPGDLAIHWDYSDIHQLSPDGHVNIVVGVSGTQVTLIGGDQFNPTYGSATNYGGSAATNYSPAVPNTSIVSTEYSPSYYSDGILGIIGYVSPTN
jgi:hypothetical protein